MKQLTVLMIVVLIGAFSACQLKPLKPGRIADIPRLIAQRQARNVRESWGTLAHECFTDLDYRAFREQNLPEAIAEGLKSNRRFMEAMLALHELPAEEQVQFIAGLERPLRLTWRQLGRITREGTTLAGQRAEIDIARAIANSVRDLVALPVGDLEAIWLERN